MKHGHAEVSVVTVLGTDTCLALARHALDTPKECRILNNHKITCWSCVL